jgi:hypothetical protein
MKVFVPGDKLAGFRDTGTVLRINRFLSTCRIVPVQAVFVKAGN